MQEYAREEKWAWLSSRLKAVRRQSDRLNRLISELLDISRIVGGQLQLEPELFDATALVREVVADFKEHGELDRTRSEIHLQLEGPVVGQWDRARLEQVVTNLLSNALKYGAGKPVTLSASSRDGWAQLTVEDQGIGIAPIDHKRIFGRFERAVSARHYGGLGRGSSSCGRSSKPWEEPSAWCPRWARARSSRWSSRWKLGVRSQRSRPSTRPRSSERGGAEARASYGRVESRGAVLARTGPGPDLLRTMNRLNSCGGRKCGFSKIVPFRTTCECVASASASTRPWNALMS